MIRFTTKPRGPFTGDGVGGSNAVGLTCDKMASFTQYIPQTTCLQCRSINSFGMSPRIPDAVGLADVGRQTLL